MGHAGRGHPERGQREMGRREWGQWEWGQWERRQWEMGQERGPPDRAPGRKSGQGPGPGARLASGSCPCVDAVRMRRTAPSSPLDLLPTAEAEGLRRVFFGQRSGGVAKRACARNPSVAAALTAAQALAATLGATAGPLAPRSPAPNPGLQPSLRHAPARIRPRPIAAIRRPLCARAPHRPTHGGTFPRRPSAPRHPARLLPLPAFPVTAAGTAGRAHPGQAAPPSDARAGR